MITIPKGQSTPLQYTQEGRQRVTVGIAWETPEIMPTRPEPFVSKTDDSGVSYAHDIDIEVGFVQEVYDLDLVCLMFGEDKTLLDAVSPAPEEAVDVSGAVYHTGDDTEGFNAGDDEQISVELANLPYAIHHLVFICIIQSGHLFGQVLNARVLVADGKTNKGFFQFQLGHQGQDGSNKTGCAMLSLSRGGSTGWVLTNLSEYRIDKNVADWSMEVTPFLKDL